MYELNPFSLPHKEIFLTLTTHTGIKISKNSHSTAYTYSARARRLSCNTGATSWIIFCAFYRRFGTRKRNNCWILPRFVHSVHWKMQPNATECCWRRTMESGHSRAEFCVADSLLAERRKHQLRNRTWRWGTANVGFDDAVLSIACLRHNDQIGEARHTQTSATKTVEN